MQSAEVTPKVWEHILAARAGRACLCCGEWATGERAAMALYGSMLAAPGTPQVVAQIGQSLDGRVATVTGDAADVSGPDGLAHLHRMRALVDAVIVGVKTALHDDPRLTVRLVPGQNPARVVIDPSGRLPNDARLFAEDGTRRIVIQEVDKPRPEGVEIIRLPRKDWISPPAIVSALRKLGLHHLMVEGGAITIARFIEADMLARLHVAVAPLLIGAGPQGLTTRPVARLAQARRPETQVYGLGSDVLFDCVMGARVAAEVWPHARQPAARLG
ncbi:MAG: RibD family protein [Roseovarius sp.]|jgi:riboflavin-specific deaminase-like protein|uniref:RibD family protein n=1 Tax=Roseovarius sp. TaxID=1486281 RepID=UPI00262988D9|nr:RibD family protein [Roseovarius sp.]